MLKIKRLRLRAIGRFVDQQEIEFDGLGNLIQVDGENRNTGGSSGAAKSTIFNGLDFLLGLNSIPSTVLQSRLTKDKMTIGGDFDWDGKNITIERGAKLAITIDGTTITGSSGLTEEKLDEIIGMPRDIFRKILHKRQKEGGFFLDFKPKEMYEFLTDAKNLVAERKKLEKVEAKLSELDTKKTSRQINLLSIQSALKATQEGILSLGLPPIKDIHQPVILELKGKYDVSTSRFKEIEEKHASESQALESSRPVVSVNPYDVSSKEKLEKRKKLLNDTNSQLGNVEAQRINGIRSIISEKNLEQSKISYQITDAVTAKNSASELALEIKKIRDAICPTCEQSWVNEAAKVKEDQLLTKLSLHKEKITLGALATERLVVLKTEISDLNEQLKPVIDPQIATIKEEIIKIEEDIRLENINASEHLNKQNVANSSILQHFATNQVELKNRHSLEITQVRGQMDIDRRAFEAAVSKLKAYEDARNRYESSLNLMKEKEKETTEKLSLAELELVNIDKELEKASELKKAIKLFISCAFDDALSAIGDAATKIIRCIPTMNNATIQFEGQKENKDGKIKEEVNAVISMDGDIGIPIKSLSGGERSSVDLAVDLAVIDFVESESGKGIDVFILDEPFTGLDTVSIEMALEVLKNSNSTKKLIVVDHNPEVKQMVSNRLVAVRDGSTSTINKEVSGG